VIGAFFCLAGHWPSFHRKFNPAGLQSEYKLINNFKNMKIYFDRVFERESLGYIGNIIRLSLARAANKAILGLLGLVFGRAPWATRES
jgi:hypothetical protein